MSSSYKYGVLFLCLTAQNVFAGQIDNSNKVLIDVKAFPNNDINYFNKAESWRLVYGELGKPPPYDPDNNNHCNTNEKNPDEVLAFNITGILKNAGDNFSEQHIHVYYDGDAGKKALALRLNEAKIKNSVLRMAEVLIRQENSKFAQLTPDRLLKKLGVLNDNEDTMMYVCFGYLQQFAATPIQASSSDTTSPRVDPRKIVFWYDGEKATPPLPPVINATPSYQVSRHK
jgi:hypothetical protein